MCAPPARNCTNHGPPRAGVGGKLKTRETGWPPGAAPRLRDYPAGRATGRPFPGARRRPRATTERPAFLERPRAARCGAGLGPPAPAARGQHGRRPHVARAPPARPEQAVPPGQGALGWVCLLASGGSGRGIQIIQVIRNQIYKLHIHLFKI